MTITEYLFIFLGVPVGLVCGLLPSISMSVALIGMYGILLGVPFDTAISFFIVGHITVYFSASVLALWIGVAGDPSTFPILSERDKIIKNNLLGTALKRTAQASAISSICGLVMLFSFMYFISGVVDIFIYTHTSAALLTIMFIISLFWKSNKFYINLFLVIASVIIGNIGYHLKIGKSFLVFDNPALFGGIPLVPVILGMYAFPIMYDAFIESKNRQKNNNEYFELVVPKENVPFLPVIRGTIMGFFMGLVPLFGSSVSSNAIYFVENKIKNNTALDKITSAESANNASAVSLLAPLLILGVAILPSEMVLLSILQDNGWTIGHITFHTFVLLTFSIIVAIICCYILCVNYAVKLVAIFDRYQRTILIFFVAVMVWGIYNNGDMIAQSNFYIIILILSTIVGFIMRKLSINPIPFIIGFLLSTKALDVYLRSYSLILSSF